MQLRRHEAKHFRDITDYCEQQGIALDRQITDSVRAGEPELYNPVDGMHSGVCEVPTAVHLAYVVAAHLSLEGERRLFGQFLSDSPLDPAIARNAAARHFIALVNSEHQPPEGVRQDAQFKAGCVERSDSCSDAEIRFDSSFIRMYKVADGRTSLRDFRGYGFQIFTGDDDRPVFFRKGLFETTALALEPITAGGYVHPAGTLVRLESRRKLFQRASRRQELGINRSSVSTEPVSSIGRVAAMRLSAFASPPDERSDFEFYSQPPDDPAAATIAREHTIEMIRDGAVQAVQAIREQQA